MPDAIPDQSSAPSLEDVQSELRELRSMVSQFRMLLDQTKRDAVAQAKNEIVIQAGQHCQISGNNGTYTIHVQWPTTGQINGTLQCGEGDEPSLLTGTVTF